MSAIQITTPIRGDINKLCPQQVYSLKKKLLTCYMPMFGFQRAIKYEREQMQNVAVLI